MSTFDNGQMRVAMEPTNDLSAASQGVLPPLPKGDCNCNPQGIGFLALLYEDLKTHDWNLLDGGFFAVAGHRVGNWRMGFRWRLFRAPLTVAYRFLHKMTQWMFGIDLPYTVKLGRRVRIWYGGGLVVHARSIGDDVQIRHRTTVGVRKTGENLAIPVIGNAVDIGCGACLLGNIYIGDDSVIGANAVVLQDVPPRSVAVGIPAKVIKTLSETPI